MRGYAPTSLVKGLNVLLCKKKTVFTCYVMKIYNQNKVMVLLYHDTHIEVFHTPAQRKLVLIWIGTQTETSIKETGKKIIDLILEHSISLILNDNLHVQGSWDGAIEWTRMYWFPEIIKAGVRHFAWVLSDDVKARQTALDAMPMYTAIKAFATRDEGDAWLEQQNQHKLSDQYRRNQARMQHKRRKERCLLTLKQAIGGERALAEILKRLEHENPAVLQLFKQFDIKTSAEKFLIIVNVLANRYAMSSTDVLILLTGFFGGAEPAIGIREMNRLMRLIMRPTDTSHNEEHPPPVMRTRGDWLDD